MAKTRSMTANQNLNNASSRRKIKTCDNRGFGYWLDLNHDVLFLVMMQLGVIDFIAFSGVCKSWRLLALCNRNTFMASKPPMLMGIYSCGNKKKFYLEDFEGRKFKTILPHSKCRSCIGLTCGYLILYQETRTHDFWLVNPITRHELHFPCVPYIYVGRTIATAILVLVFSPSISRWVFVMLTKPSCQIWYSIEGKGAWNHVPSTVPNYDLHAFKGKIYTINKDSHLCELRLNPEPILTLLEPKIFSKHGIYFQRFVSSSENLYVMDTFIKDSHMIHKLDIGKMKWLPFEETRDEHAFFLSNMRPDVAVKLEPWAKADSWPHLKIFYDTNKNGKMRFFTTNYMCYFPHECLKVNLLNE